MSKRELNSVRLRGWMTSDEGLDYCPECWDNKLKSLSLETKRLVLMDSRPTIEVRIPDDVFCHGCGKRA